MTTNNQPSNDQNPDGRVQAMVTALYRAPVPTTEIPTLTAGEVAALCRADQERHSQERPGEERHGIAGGNVHHGRLAICVLHATALAIAAGIMPA